MPLESLLQLVETLRERIFNYGYELRGSERRTRYALIDPLLTGLGWDTSDPGTVRIEYDSGEGRADYALFAGGRLRMMVEAKALWKSLGERVLQQGGRYSMKRGASHFCITNGAQWRIYETHDSKLVGEFDVSRWPISEVEKCMKAVPLWKPGPWHRLEDIKYATGLKPDGLLSLDTDTVNLRSWRDLPVEITRWLIADGFLTPDDCPIAPERTVSKRYLVNTKPRHRSRRKFRSPSEGINGLFVELDYRPDSHLKNAKTIIEHAGQDPADFKVRFA